MHSREGPDPSTSVEGPRAQAPLVICSVAGNARELLISNLMRDYPSKFGTAIR